MNVSFIDLRSARVDCHSEIGPEESSSFNPKEGDITHFNEKGAEVIADLVVKELRGACGDLARHLNK